VRALLSFDDVARVCESYGLQRLTGEDVHPYAWLTPDRTVAVAVACVGKRMTGVQVQFTDPDIENYAEPLVTVQPYTAGSTDCLAAVLRIALEQVSSP
jgi:hypothetical protein